MVMSFTISGEKKNVDKKQSQMITVPKVDMKDLYFEQMDTNKWFLIVCQIPPTEQTNEIFKTECCLSWFVVSMTTYQTLGSYEQQKFIVMDSLL